MSKKLTGVTNGEYTLEEIREGEEFWFFRNDNGILRNIGTLPVEMYARYLVQKMNEGEIDNGYTRELNYELSVDGKVLKLMLSEQARTNLYIVKNSEREEPEVIEPQGFKPVFTKWFD